MMDINAPELLELLQNKGAINVLDVREPIEYHTWNIGGLNIPVSGLEQKLDSLQWGKDEEIIVVCRAGIRSTTAKSILELNGYKNIRNLCGGLMALQKIQA